MPGMMKMNTGRSFRKAAKIVPRRASLSLGAPSVRCTMYWSVHQYHNPMIGAQKSIPSHGKLVLKYQAMPAGLLDRRPGALDAGRNQRLPQIERTPCRARARSPLHPPSSDSPKKVSRSEPMIRISVCSASVYATARMPPITV